MKHMEMFGHNIIDIGSFLRAIDRGIFSVSLISSQEMAFACN
jgi:hypothetical protein